MERFTGLGIVDQVLNKGGYKAAVRVLRGPQVDLMVMPPGVHMLGVVLPPALLAPSS